RPLLAVRVEDPAVDGGPFPRQRAEFVMGPDDGGEKPGADDLVALWSLVHREHRLEEGVVLTPAPGDQRRQRGRRPGVEDVVLTDEATRLAALVFGVARRNIGAGVDR